jgi:hypothetical protein
VRGALPRPGDGPLIVYLNHPGWWDGYMCFLIARELLRGRFDVVYLEPGALRGELDALVAGVQQALRPLGWLVAYDRHPFAASRDDYFESGAWTLGDLVTAVSQGGLVVKRLEEFPALRDPRVPGEFLLRAEKPQ